MEVVLIDQKWGWTSIKYKHRAFYPETPKDAVRTEATCL